MNEAERLAAVRRYEILDTPPHGAFDRITRIAARMFGVPIAIVSIVDEDRIWFKSRYGLDVEEIPRTPGLCASAILKDEPWLLTDAARDPRSLANPLVAGEFGLRFYLGVPLRTDDGHSLGTLCVIDKEPREVTEDQVEALKELAAVVVDEMEIRLSGLRALSQRDLLLKEVHHRVRNNLQVVASLLHLQERTAPFEAKEVLEQTARRIQTMAHLHQQFYSGKQDEAVCIRDHLLNVAALTVDSFGAAKRIRVFASGEDIRMDFDVATPLSLLVTEIVSNTCKHAFHSDEQGQIGVDVTSARGNVIVQVSDSGRGFNGLSGASMGLRLIDSFAAQLKGRLDKIADSPGTVYCLRFPESLI